MFAVGPRHFLDRNAASATGNAAHRVNKKHRDSPQGHELKPPLAERIVTWSFATTAAANRSASLVRSERNQSRCPVLVPSDVVVNEALLLFNAIEDSLELHLVWRWVLLMSLHQHQYPICRQDAFLPLLETDQAKAVTRLSLKGQRPSRPCGSSPCTSQNVCQRSARTNVDLPNVDSPVSIQITHRFCGRPRFVWSGSPRSPKLRTLPAGNGRGDRLHVILNHNGAKFGEAHAIQHRFPTKAKGDSHGAALKEAYGEADGERQKPQRAGSKQIPIQPISVESSQPFSIC